MRADYDSSADTIQIELEPVDRLDHDDASLAGILVGIREQRPVLIDVIDTRSEVEERLRGAAEHYDLDGEALVAAARAALAAPDRAIVMDVAVRAAA